MLSSKVPHCISRECVCRSKRSIDRSIFLSVDIVGLYSHYILRSGGGVLDDRWVFGLTANQCHSNIFTLLVVILFPLIRSVFGPICRHLFPVLLYIDTRSSIYTLILLLLLLFCSLSIHLMSCHLVQPVYGDAYPEPYHGISIEQLYRFV